MPPLLIDYPQIDPILFEIGPFAVRWYALAYIAGLVIGWRYCVWLAAKPPLALARELFDDFLVWAIIAVLLGGRLGYVLFYKPGEFLANPIEIPMLWHGGMSFHGGMLGMIVALYLFARNRRVPFFTLMDVIAVAGPIGLFFGRLANFINAELYGRPTDVAWAMIFPGGGPEPRHPSQLYEAALEGILLFVLLHVVARYSTARLRYGMVSGLFLIGYGSARIIVEFFRQPDSNLGYLFGFVTMGQLLSVPMILLGIWLMVRAKPAPPTSL
jgi:phosphatidylglycerol:prolipoprotein diacylglycerol transferase